MYRDHTSRILYNHFRVGKVRQIAHRDLDKSVHLWRLQQKQSKLQRKLQISFFTSVELKIIYETAQFFVDNFWAILGEIIGDVQK